MYQLVNVITCEISYPASPNSVCGFFMGTSRYLGHLDLLSRSLKSTQSACERKIINPTSPNSICGFFMDFNEMLTLIL